MAYDMPGLTKGVRALSFKRLERLILNLYGDDLRRAGPVGTGPADGPAERRSYGLHTAKVSGFPNMLLLAILFNIDAGALVDQLTQAVHVNRMESQDDLESAMRVSVGPGARLCPSPPSYNYIRDKYSLYIRDHLICRRPCLGAVGPPPAAKPSRDWVWQPAVYN